MPASAGPLSTTSLTKRGTLATGLAVAANLVVYYLAKALLAIPPVFEPMDPGRVAVLTLLGSLGAIGAYLVVQRVADDPPRAFVDVAIVALVVSFLPDILLLVTDEPGATVGAVATLMVMHTVAAVILVAGLTWGRLGHAGPMAPHQG